MRISVQKPQATQELKSDRSVMSGRTRFGQGREVDSTPYPQHTIGNHARQQMMQTNAEPVEDGLASTNLPRFAHDFSQIPVHPSPSAHAQAKLRVGPPGNNHEQHADRISEQAMRMPEPRRQQAGACGGGCQTGSTERAGREHSLGQAEGIGSSNLGLTTAPPIVHEVLRSPGQALDPATRAFMEPRFGRDFSGVRVHTDQIASRSAKAVAAQAYTVGSDIVFGAGRYAPACRDGQRLLAHELVHVQQQSGPAQMLRRQPDSDKAKPDVGKQPLTPPSVHPEWKPADAVVELRWLTGNDWKISLSGRTSLESTRAMLWPKWMPSTVTMIFNGAVIDPIELGSFTISGLEAFHLKYMEPSIAAIFRERGVVDDTKDSPELATARDAFRKNNPGLGEWMQRAIHVALKRATRANADLMLAFYRHYSSHDLERDDMSGLGETSSGDTEISERVLMLEKDPKRSSDPLSLLGSTLIHEFVHTPQGPKEIGGQATQLPKEAKAYAIELLFSERMGDTKRAADIEKQWLRNDSLIKGMGADKVFVRTYRIISRLYEIIDSKGGAEAAAARRMSVEFISRNDADYGAELRDFLSRN